MLMRRRPDRQGLTHNLYVLLLQLGMELQLNNKQKLGQTNK